MTGLDVQDAAANADNIVNPALLAASMIEERAADIVEALNDMPPDLAVAVLLHLPPDRAVEVLDQPGLEREPELVTLMPREAAAKLLAGMSADRVADIFRQVKEPHHSELLDLLDPDARVNTRRLLEYPKDTAGSIMTTEFASVPSTYTVEQTLDYIRHVDPNLARRKHNVIDMLGLLPLQYGRHDVPALLRQPIGRVVHADVADDLRAARLCHGQPL
jgi:magnesium transporter